MASQTTRPLRRDVNHFCDTEVGRFHDYFVTFKGFLLGLGPGVLAELRRRLCDHMNLTKRRCCKHLTQTAKTGYTKRAQTSERLCLEPLFRLASGSQANHQSADHLLKSKSLSQAPHKSFCPPASAANSGHLAKRGPSRLEAQKCNKKLRVSCGHKNRQVPSKCKSIGGVDVNIFTAWKVRLNTKPKLSVWRHSCLFLGAGSHFSRSRNHPIGPLDRM